VLIRELSQEDADSLIKSLSGIYLTNWKTAFHEERGLPSAGLVALSKEKRTYYLVESYLAGVSWSNLSAANLSSFARVLPTHPAGSCATCLKTLFEHHVFPKCRLQGKTQIVAKLEPGGVQVFKELQALMPGVQLNQGFYWDASVPVPLHKNL
jgi:hypothetical protein